MSKPIKIKNCRFDDMTFKEQKNNLLDPNFSMYVETQIKHTPPTEDFLQQYIHKIYPKISTEWIDSDLVVKCQSCAIKFGFFTRKHHCRACGGVFCSSCCHQHIVIPINLLDVPKESQILRVSIKKFFNKISKDYNPVKSLVCNDCASKINHLYEIEHIIKICEYLNLDDLYDVLVLNKKWYNATIHCLSKFRNIQYKSSEHIYNNWECNILWNSRNNLSGHNNWIITLIKTTIINKMKYKNNNTQELIKLIENYTTNKNKNCWQLMCSRKCNMDIDILDVLEIIQYIAKIPEYNNQFWENTDFPELILLLVKYSIKNNTLSYSDYIIPFLTISLRLLIQNYNKYSTDYIYKILDLICGNNQNTLLLLTLEYNYLKNIKPQDINNDNFCQLLHNYLKTRLNVNLKSIITKTINTMIQINTNKNMSVDNYTSQLPIIYPFDTRYLITDILEIKELTSASKPLLVKVLIKKIDSENNNKIDKKFIIKNDPQLRKENIVASLIILLQNKLIQQSRKGRIDIFEPIPTYKVIMITNSIGIVEFLDDCYTLSNISNMKYTLQNFILENNKDIKIGIIKERFSKSLAISSCLSYVLGLGDRHANNIMISNNAHIIHIDYGYILENPIHSNIVNNPIIRISNDMIDFLGGWSSEYYTLFKNYIIKVFDLIRLYANIITSYYFILGYEKVMDWEKYKKRLLDRFLNGMSFKDVEVVMLDVIESSSKSYGGVFIDICNEYGQKFKHIL
jgi:hypothetical protein